MTARIALSIGCPCGIGPEVSVASAAAAAARGPRVLLVGDHGALSAAAKGRGVAVSRLVRVAGPLEAWDVARGKIPVWQPTRDLPERDRRPGAPTRTSGRAQLAWIDAACDAVARGEADALVTGPVSKEVIGRSGAPGASSFLGHTEHLQRRLRAREVVMAFWSPALVTSLVTTHMPLARVAGALTPAGVAGAPVWLGWLLGRLARGAPAADRHRGAQPARGRGGPVRPRRAPRDHAGHRAGTGEAAYGRHRRHRRRAGARGERVSPRHRARLGRRRGDVPRPGHHPDEALGLRRRGERIARPSDRADQRRSRHRLRSRRRRSRRTRRACARRSRSRPGSPPGSPAGGRAPTGGFEAPVSSPRGH